MSIQVLINGADRESLSISTKDPVTVGTGYQDMLDSVNNQEINHFFEHNPKVIFPAEVMGNLEAAVEDYAEAGQSVSQVLIDAERFIGPRSREGASGEKNGVAVLRKSIIAEAFRRTALFIGEAA